MGRLSIDLSEQDHRRLRSLAESRGMSIEDFVLERALCDDPYDADEEAAEAELAAILDYRIAAADRGEISDKTVSEIAAEARARARAR